MVKIAKDPDLSDQDKANLIMYARNNFKNRRKMAYIGLYVIVGSFALLFLAAFVDGISGSTAILSGFSSNQALFGTIEGLLASIVAAYYGVSGWRPSS